MKREIGIRVGAILSANHAVVKFLGYGVYQGDLLRPGWEREAQAYLPVAREVDGEAAQRSYEDFREQIQGFADWYKENRPEQADFYANGRVEELAREQYDKAQAKAKWTDEQIIEHLKTTSMLTNPCILLDSGKTVWGMECWWGDEEAVKQRLERFQAGGAEVVIVDIDEERAR